MLAGRSYERTFELRPSWPGHTSILADLAGPRIKDHNLRTMSGPEDGRDMVGDLLAPLPRSAMVPAVQAVLAVTWDQAEKITKAFDDFVAQPQEANLRRLTAHDLAARNPMIYTARGTRTVEEWVDRVLMDKETSAIEGQLGTWQEEVAGIVSGGIKPGNGVDLQLEAADGVIHLYAIQTSSNTKNSGGRKTDVASLKRAARPLRASKRFVEMNIAVLRGRAKTGAMPSEPDITVVGSDDFWGRVSGIPDFRVRLLKVSMILSPLVRKRAADEVTRIKAEALALFSDADGGLKLDALADPPKRTRRKTPLVQDERGP